MTRWLFAGLALLVPTLPLVGSYDLIGVAHAQSASQRFWVQVTGADDPGAPVTNRTLCRVVNSGANTEPTIYTDGQLGTAASNPLTANTTTGECEWYMGSGTTAVDLWVYVQAGPYAGAAVRMSNVRRDNIHKVLVSRPMTGMARVTTVTTATGSVNRQALSETLPAGALVRDVVVETVTAVANSTMNVGLVNGGFGADILFCSAASTGAAGFVNCSTTATLVTVNNTGAISYHNQNHASKAYIHMYYYDTGNRG